MIIALTRMLLLLQNGVGDGKKVEESDMWKFVDAPVFVPKFKVPSPKNTDSEHADDTAVAAVNSRPNLPEMDQEWWTKVEKHRPGRTKRVSFKQAYRCALIIIIT